MFTIIMVIVKRFKQQKLSMRKTLAASLNPTKKTFNFVLLNAKYFYFLKVT